MKALARSGQACLCAMTALLMWASPAAAQSGTVTGTVTNSSSAPLQNVSIWVYTTSGAYVTGAVTDANGVYTTSVVPDGNYKVITWNNQGYVDQAYNGVPCPNASCNFAALGTSVPVSSSGQTANINFTLLPGSTVSGTIVTATDGVTPIANAGVSLVNSSGQFVANGNTDPNGHYTTTAVPPGTYFVQANGPYQGFFVSQVYNGVACYTCTPATLAGASPVNLTAGPVSGVNFALTPGAPIGGAVTNAVGGAGLSGVAIFVYSSTGTQLAVVSTDPSGNYSTADLPTGSYYLRTSNSSGFADQLYNGVACSNCSVTGSGGTLVPVVAGTNTTGINFALTQPVNGTITGIITNSSSAPLQNVNVSVYTTTGSFITSAVTNGSGVYKTPVLAAGSYKLVTFNALGYIDQLYNGITCSGNSCFPITAVGTAVSVSSSSQTTGINFTLSPGVMASGAVTSAAGGAPIQNVSVSVVNGSGVSVAFAQTNASGVYTTAAFPAGTYFLRASNPLNSFFVDQVYNGVNCIGCAAQTVAGSAPVTFTSGTTSGLNFSLSPGAAITGTITNAAGGAALSGITVFVYTSAGVQLTSTVTNSSGVFTTSVLPAASYYVKTSNSSGFGDELYNGVACSNCSVTSSGGTLVPVTAGANTTGINFALSQNVNATITGTVKNSSNAALQNVTVFVLTTTGSVLSSVNTNASGVYTTGVLAAGSYKLRTSNNQGYVDQLYNGVSCPGGTCSTSTLGNTVGVNTGSQTANINFTLSTGATASGIVVSAVDGVTPIPGVSVSVVNSSGSTVASGLTNASGAYTTQAFPTGTYFLRTSNSAGFVDQVYSGVTCLLCAVQTVAGSTTVTFGVGTTNGLNFSLAQGARITGTITNASGGAALSGVSVFAYSSTGTQVASVATNASGVFTTAALPTGSYYVRTSNGSGFIDQIYNGVPCLNCSVTTSGGTPLGLTAGTDATGVNFSLSAGAHISGTVTDASTSSGIASVTVQLFNSAGAQLSSAVTSGTGAYAISTGLPTGNYFLRTSNNVGYIDQLYNNIQTQPLPSPQTGTALGVTAPNATTVNFSMAKGGVISGTVTNNGGSGLSGVSVQVIKGSGSSATTLTTVTTAANGTYTTSGLLAGAYTLRTSNGLGFIDQIYNSAGNVVCLGCSNSTVSTSGSPVTVTLGATTPNINFPLTLGSRISGTISGAGSSPISVSVVNAAGTNVNTVTTSTGSYQTGSLPAGTYYLRTTNSSGFVDQVYNGITCAPCAPQAVGTGVTVDGTTNVGNVNFTVTSGGKIGGTVTDSVGNPLSGVSVTAFSVSGNTSTSITSTATAANGTYTLQSDLVGGNSYYVRTSNSLGFIDQLYNNVPCEGCSIVTLAPSATAIPVASGVTTPNINFALNSGGRVTGTITSASTGQPLSGVIVEVLDGNSVQVASATTNASGVYTTTAMPAGNYYVYTSNSQGYANQVTNAVSCNVSTCGPSTPGASAVNVPGAGTTAVNFALSPGAFITGIVKSTTGIPVTTQFIAVYDVNGVPLLESTYGSDGSYSLGPLVAGSYYLQTANQQGFIDQAYPNVPCVFCQLNGQGNSLVVASGASTLSLTAGQQAVVNFTLDVGGSISGTVRDASTGLPLSGMSIILSSPVQPGVYRHTVTDANGVYQTTGVPAGVYYIGYQGLATQPYVQQLGGDITCAYCDVTQGAPIQVPLGVTVTGVNLNLVHGGHVSGAVTDASTGAGVLMYVNIFDAQGRRVSYPATSNGGAFTSVALPAGSYFARTSTVPPEFTSYAVPVASQGYIPQLFNGMNCAGCKVATGTSIAVTVDNTASGVDFNLVQGARIGGNIKDASTSTGIPNATVRFYSTIGALVSTVTTDANGAYVTIDGLPAGSYYARTFNTSGYIDQVLGGSNCAPSCTVTGGTAIVVPASGTITAPDVSLVFGGRVSGTATDSSTGQPLSAVTVNIYDSTGAIASTALTNYLGQYTSGAGLLAGAYRAITSSSQGYVSQAYAGVDCVGCDPTSAGTAVAVTLGNTSPGVNFALNAGGRISGTITDGSGNPIVGAQVEIWAAPFQRAATTATTGAAGQYLTLDSLPAGSYTARTANTLGYVNVVYSSLICLVTCDASTGNPIFITGTATTTGINFSLSLDADTDGDGINNTIDRNHTTLADESGFASNDFTDVPLGGVTEGTITNRAGWNVTVFDISPDGVHAQVTGAGIGAAQLDVCHTGGAEQVMLDATGETAWITCQTADGGTKVKAVVASPTIELQKTVGAITTVIEITTGQAATIGSPAVADPNNTDPLLVRILDASGNQIGSYSLAPGTAAEATAAAGGGVQLTVSSGSVTATLYGQNVTVGSGQSLVVPPPDTTPPVLTVPATITVEAVDTSGAIVSYTASAADDHDGSVTPVCAPASGATFAIGTTQVSCTATDAHGNASTKMFSVIVQDTTPPVISNTPSGASAEATSAAGAVVTYPSPTAIDSVDGSVPVNCAPASGGTFAVGATLVTCTAIDAHGNAATTTFNVVVSDTAPPVISGTPSHLTVEQTGPAGAAVVYASPTASDTVDGSVTVNCAPVSGATFARGTTTVTCNATDAHGNAAVPTSFTVTVQDTIAPSVLIVSPMAAAYTAGQPVNANYACADGGSGIASCVGPVASGSPIDTSAAGIYTFIVVATDVAGNNVSASVTYTVTASVTGRMHGDGYVAGPAGDPDSRQRFAFDVAAVPTGQSGGRLSVWTVDPDGHPRFAHSFDTTAISSITFSDDPPFMPGARQPPTVDTVVMSGTGKLEGVDGYTFQARATDQGEPGAGKDTFALTVFDGTGAVVFSTSGVLAGGNVQSSRLPGRKSPPLFLNAPPDQVGIEATSPDGAVITYSPATAVDYAGAPVAPVCAPSSGSTFARGWTRGLCTATDSLGRTSTVSFLVLVVDTTAPVLVDVPGDTTVQANVANGATVTYALPTASDAGDASPTVRCTPAPGHTFPLGPTTVTCTATDDAGNRATAQFVITVADTTPPVFETTPGNLVAEASSAGGARVTYAKPKAADVADRSVDVSCVAPSGSTFPIGTTMVTCTATDNSGNAAVTSFTVTVVDTTAPKITIADPGGSYALHATVTASYACTDSGSGVASCTGTVANGAAINTSTDGTFTFSVEAIDAAGNSATKTVTYTVKKK